MQPMMVMPEMPEMPPKMVMPEMPPMEKMIISRLDQRMPDGYYTPDTIRQFIVNPKVYDNTRYYELLKHMAHEILKMTPPSPEPTLVNFVKCSIRVKEVVKEHAKLASL